MVYIYIAVLIVTVVVYLANILRKQLNIFKERGIKYMGPMLSFFGNTIPTLLKKKDVMEVVEEFKKMYIEEPMVGCFNLISPVLIVLNADYVERILIKDFSHFTDHGFAEFSEKTKNPFDESLFTMKGNRWRAFRQKLSPLFTSGKLKSMFVTMESYSDKLIEFLKTKSGQEYEIKEAARLFSEDVNGSSFFGIETSVLKNPDSEYHRIGKKVMDASISDILRFLLVNFLPGFIVRSFGLSVTNKEVMGFFSKVVKDTISYRKKSNMHRNDMVQLLIQLKEKNTIEVSAWDSKDDYLKSDDIATVADSFEVTEETITVQAFTFLIGGIDSLALAMMYTCFQLTQNPDIQERAQSEVLSQVKSHSGLTYDALKNMEYLENVVKETLRVHPVVPVLLRSCNKDYTFPNGYTIKKGEKLQIPSLIIHSNPSYYSEPEIFKPERFEDPPKPGTYLPFGDGPRVCLAMRYAILHIKLGVATILMNYKLKLSPKTELPLKYSAAFFLIPKTKLLFDLEEIES